MNEEVLRVDGMSCAHCKQAVEQSVGALQGVKKVTATPEKDEVVVSFEDPASINGIKGAIEDAGYEVV
ncbi:copper ion binding protein [Staphylococcus massiliensis]|uniref:Putative copper-ion-binding protein n=1 Tax=Staphylococcus massiliensis S46 TaxID=1229783 RepID=K9AM44_9STAP|nr:copper ion binding protein [Staphylococcus massiliensis]EKU47141.1 putative copper-ion-binding protein [Staphylococcus massiliensis S46]MCG3400147.1 copper ion binding protein [Staphylococcus massiliensis]MCG3402714.1 copper ion binding protein [Staphylococcus massiliensis]MCG3413363.1 copper ion binding protein [Staphylococcus massiliensis]PNZ98302.1 heavy metal transport/detoxification protein [Staphylococcus massiliensis CCUG 55927]